MTDQPKGPTPIPTPKEPPKPRIFKHEARAGDLRLTYSVSADNLATNPHLMNLLVEKLSGILFFGSISESVASHLLSDFQTMLDEFRAIFAGTPEEPDEPT